VFEQGDQARVFSVYRYENELVWHNYPVNRGVASSPLEDDIITTKFIHYGLSFTTVVSIKYPAHYIHWKIVLLLFKSATTLLQLATDMNLMNRKQVSYQIQSNEFNVRQHVRDTRTEQTHNYAAK